MDRTVTIKGNARGLTVILDENADYQTIKEALTKKFSESAKFLGNASMAVEFTGYKLDENQEKELVGIISDNSDIKVVYISDNCTQTKERYEKALMIDAAGNSHVTVRQPQVQNAEPAAQDTHDGKSGEFFKGNVRSGESMFFEGSAVIIGNVNPGAEVIANGNVLIMGSLKGTVTAGANGERGSYVIALDMDPLQIRIADIIARSPDRPKKIRKKESKQIQIAYIINDNICIEPFTMETVTSL